LKAALNGVGWRQLLDGKEPAFMTHERITTLGCRADGFSSAGVLGALAKETSAAFSARKDSSGGYPHGTRSAAQSCRNGASLRIGRLPGGPPAIKAFARRDA